VRDLNQETITQAVIARFSNTPDARLKEIMTSLVQHLHGFARDVKLAEGEWEKGIEFLTRVGHITNDKRQEFILLSDTLGLSMLTVAMNNDKPLGCTEATVFGPFYVENAPHYELGADISNGAKGAPCFVTGRVTGIDGAPIADATMDVWQSDDDGMYDVQHPGIEHAQNRGVLNTAIDGRFHFKSTLAVAYPIPNDGPVGKMLIATNNHPWRPAHLHFRIKANGYETLVTHVFRNGDQYLDSDVVFGVRESLLADWIEQTDGSYQLKFDFVLNPVKR
jgi:hydroxyquinol 1,2-dioxygenase